jgi:hypothetical protein
MGSEILSQFLFESSEIIFEKPKKLSLGGKFIRTFLYFHCYDSKLKVGIFIYIPACRSEATLQNALFEDFLSFDKASQFSFFLNTHF